MRGFLRAALIVVFAGGGALCCYFVGGPLWRHITSLTSGIYQGHPEVSSSDPALNTHLAAFMADSRYAVQFTGNAPNTFPLDAAHRDDTIYELASSVPIDQSALIFRTTSLTSAYRLYLDDRMALIGLSLNSEDKATWASILRQLNLAVGDRSDREYALARERAEEFTASRKVPINIQVARKVFDDNSVTPFTWEKAYPNLTEPDASEFDNLIDSTAVVQGAEIADTNFSLLTLDEKTVIGNVHGIVFNAYRDVHIVRPWLSEDLLDDNVHLDSAIAIRHFGADGDMRLIPYDMVLLVGVQVLFDVGQIESNNQLPALIQKDQCCVLQSNKLTFTLAPESVYGVGKSRYFGHSINSSPQLVAIVSRRRAS